MKEKNLLIKDSFKKSKLNNFNFFLFEQISFNDRNYISILKHNY